MPKSIITIVGAGIFGLTTAIKLRERGYAVKVISPSIGLDHMSASYDISKIVRMEYGSDLFYMQAANTCIDIWHDWNVEAEYPLYREVGFVLLCKRSMDHSSQKFERASYDNLLKIGMSPERLSGAEISSRYPAYREGAYQDGFYNARAGYAESAKTLEFLRSKAMKMGVQIIGGKRIASIETEGRNVVAIHTTADERIVTNELVVCAGASSQQFIPGLHELLVSTGHPVFHFKPADQRLYESENFPVFAADISNTGWYGFPWHPTEHVVKVANHGVGLKSEPFLEYHPLEEHQTSRVEQFLTDSIPSLVSSPIVFTRRCFYADTFDGHFLIDRHPDYDNLTIGTGGSGHGFKMGPLLGRWIANAVEGKKVPGRFRWRNPEFDISNEEEARSAT